MNATWQYEMLGGMTVMSLDIVCSSEQCKVYEFKDIPCVLISGLCAGVCEELCAYSKTIWSEWCSCIIS